MENALGGPTLVPPHASALCSRPALHLTVDSSRSEALGTFGLASFN